MSNPTYKQTELEEAAERLVASLVKEGNKSPVMPTGLRSKYEAIVIRVLVDPKTLDNYRTALDKAKMSHGVKLEKRQPDDIEKMPAIQEIATQGLGVLSDTVLADLALRPLVLKLLSDSLNEIMDQGEVEVSDVWWNEVQHVGDEDYPHINAENGSRLLERLKKGDKIPNAFFTQKEPAKEKTTNRKTFASSTALFAMAASLLIGVALGGLFFGKGGVGEGKDLVAANANISNVQARGTAVALEMQARSERQGFATFILIGPKKPLVFPDYGEELLQTDGKTQVRYGPIEAEPGFLMLTIITETPATEILRRAASQGDLSSRDPESLRKTISELLWKANFHWIAFHSATVPAAK